MSKSKKQLRVETNMDSLLSLSRKKFEAIKDERSSNCSFKLNDILMSALAMFSLKYPSLHNFEQQTNAERGNLRNLFGVKQLCTDAQMRNVLDNVSPKEVQDIFIPYQEHLNATGIWEEYQYLDGCPILSVDGVEHFHSTKIHCNNCLEKQCADGTHYAHQMLCGAIVYPGKKEVFPIVSEPVIKQDGNTKNDCERNAASRLLEYINEHYKGKKFIYVEDALYSNAPHVLKIKSTGSHFIIGIKPDSHQSLFQAIEGRTKGGLANKQTIKEGLIEHRFIWINGTPINAANPDVMVNVIDYQEYNTKTMKLQKFTWITDFKITHKNVYKIMKAGRSRWKIENETFNTLKNQGYHFEHNYGHGYKNLATVLSKLMLLAFLIDQVLQACNTLFQEILKVTKTKRKLWDGLRALFQVKIFKNFKELYFELAHLHRVQIE